MIKGMSKRQYKYIFGIKILCQLHFRMPHLSINNELKMSTELLHNIHTYNNLQCN